MRSRRRGVGREGHDGLHVGLVGGEGDLAAGIGLVAVEVVCGQAGELVDCVAVMVLAPS